ncbi:hypothetical protein EJ05DRAFT_479141 [Pseudovirgaria hyperparasitica]|uniref:Uncharacterized protein n=1 Tax=Pseudovirgaria hyperparasitica TaxID=470096 RepID=A0A6A6VY14_9PEZI|nr:uncharacterized protein EJ05DRAFT_479141 [Pseudovirgaria hyperparasitica]KAF2754706.1 hypothetical protein EJ05DRAFT_479141 [Pseudovirgaria hyperparasitica]
MGDDPAWDGQFATVPAAGPQFGPTAALEGQFQGQEQPYYYAAPGPQPGFGADQQPWGQDGQMVPDSGAAVEQLFGDDGQLEPTQAQEQAYLPAAPAEPRTDFGAYMPPFEQFWQPEDFGEYEQLEQLEEAGLW